MTTTMVGRPYLTPDEAAEYLGVSTRYLRQLTYERRLAFHRVGRLLRFTVEDLDAYVTANRTEAVDAT